MNVLLLFRGSGNWMGFLLIIIAAYLLFMGIEWLYRYIRQRSSRNPRIFHRHENVE